MGDTSVKIDLPNLNGIINAMGKVKGLTAKVGVTDPGVARYAAYVEFGWVQRVTGKQAGWMRAQGVSVPPGATLHSPPRPIFHATAQGHSKEWCAVARNAWKQGAPLAAGNAAQKAVKALETAAVAAQNEVVNTIATGGAAYGFPKRSPLTMALYAALNKGHKAGGGNTSTGKPLALSGRLLASIGYQMTKG